jgi:hypothetical protein
MIARFPAARIPASGPEDAHDRVIPWADNSDHAEGNIFHARLGVGRQRGMLRGLHPIFGSRRSVAECIHGAESLESGLLGAAMAKVFGHGDSDGVTCPREHRRCARQPISARRRIRDSLLCMRSALELYEVMELGLEVGGGHLDAPCSNREWLWHATEI